MKLVATLAVLAGMISVGCAGSLPQAAPPPAGTATLTSAAPEGDLAPNPYGSPLFLTDEDVAAKPAAPEGVWAPAAPAARTWGEPSKADLPDRL